jgi:chromosome partitioning protein
LIKRLLLASPKGGATKTTTARHIAVSATLEGLKVATADLDRQKTLSKWYERRGEALTSFTHFALTLAEAQVLIEDVVDFDLLVIDTPPAIEEHPTEMRLLIEAADVVLIPTQPTIDDVESVIELMRLVKSLGRPAAFLLSRLKPRVNILGIKRRLNAAGPLCPIEVHDRADFSRASERGMALTEIPGHPGGEEMQGVWEYVRGLLWEQEAPARKTSTGRGR